MYQCSVGILHSFRPLARNSKGEEETPSSSLSSLVLHVSFYQCVSCLHAWFYSHMRDVANQHQTLRERKNLDHYHSLVCHIVVSHILIIWALAMTLTLKTANNFCSAWHLGSFCCITIPSLVTKCYAVQKISSGQTFTDILNLHCDLDLECSTPIILQDTLAYDAVLSKQVWLQTDQHFRRYSRNSLLFFYIF